MANCMKARGGGSGTPKVEINVYGGAYETITLGNYTTLTNENGLGTMEVKESDVGKSFTPSCSVSGYNTSVTLSADTYCMPTNVLMLYWYGNECIANSGGWEKCAGRDGTYDETASSKETNYLYISNSGNKNSAFTNKTKINSTSYTKLCVNGDFEVGYSLSCGVGTSPSSVYMRCQIPSGTNATNEYKTALNSDSSVNYDNVASSTNYICVWCYGATNTAKFKKIWLE